MVPRFILPGAPHIQTMREDADGGTMFRHRSSSAAAAAESASIAELLAGSCRHVRPPIRFSALIDHRFGHLHFLETDQYPNRIDHPAIPPPGRNSGKCSPRTAGNGSTRARIRGRACGRCGHALTRRGSRENQGVPVAGVPSARLRPTSGQRLRSERCAYPLRQRRAQPIRRLQRMSPPGRRLSGDQSGLGAAL